MTERKCCWALILLPFLFQPVVPVFADEAATVDVDAVVDDAAVADANELLPDWSSSVGVFS